MKHRPGVSGLLPIVAAYCVGMCILPLQLMGFDLSRIPGDLGDARLNNYFLEHGYKWLTGQAPGFWDAPFFYPTLRTMSFSDNHLGTLPIYALFRLLEFDRETSYQIWFLVIFTLDYFSCAWVLRKLSINPLGAAVGAFIFSFSLPMAGQMNHSQLLPRFMIPFTFFFAIKYLENKSNKTFMLACATFSIQFYLTMYMGLFLVLALLLFFIASTVVRGKRYKPSFEFNANNYKAVSIKALAVIATFVSLLPLMLPYRKTSLELGARSWEEIRLFLPRISSYLSPPGGSLLWSWIPSMNVALGKTGEHFLFVGALPFAAFAMMPAVYCRFRKDSVVITGMIAWLTMTCLIVLTLHGDLSLYKIALYIPGFSGVRVVSRVILLELFFLSLIMGVIITKISESKTFLSVNFPKAGTVALLLLSLTLDQYVSASDSAAYSKSGSQHRLRNIENIVKEKNPSSGVFAYMPQNSPEPPYVIHLDAMMAAQDLHMATVNGYSGKFPKGFGYFYEHPDRCDGYIFWLIASMRPTSSHSDIYNSISNVAIIGRGSCLP